ncbi:MAG TPA: CDP-glucose 4,6-dehydratase [Terracidiphilus sp.]|nr:CDP-glucose 4,6-dehydratase [Terracidiphilus sp.]
MGQREGTVEDVVTRWRGRRVLVTGHTGFKGGWLALWLKQLGATVRGYALEPDTEPNLFTVARVGEAVEDVRGDVRDLAELKRALSGFRPEVVFHLAAQPLVRRSYADPLETFSTNVMGTANLLEAVRETPGVRAVVCVTTDKVYRNEGEDRAFIETDALGGHDPYAASKACAEIVTNAYRDSFFSLEKLAEHGVAVATARAGNVIGGGDWSRDRLIPDLVRGVMAGEAILIRRPKATRPWQHVLEPLHGYLLLAEGLLTEPARFARAFNFGPAEEDAWPVERIATKIAELWGQGARWVKDDAEHVHEDHYLRLDASKARSELGWKPRLEIGQGLEWTLEWYRAWQSGAAMREFTLKQMEAYERLG